MKTDLLRGARERMRTGIIDKTMTQGHRIDELERAPATGSVQVERQIIAAAGGGGGGTTPLAYATTAEIADIATSESAGTSSLVARGDHVHNHPAIGSGDLHTQYLLADGTRALAGDWAAGDARTISVGKVTVGYSGDTTRLALRGYGGIYWETSDPVLGVTSGDGFTIGQTYSASAPATDNKAFYATLALAAGSGSSSHNHAGIGALLRVDDFGRTYSGEPSAIRAIAAVIASSGTYAQLTVQRFEANNSGTGGTVTSTYLAHFFPLQGAGSTAFGTFKAIVIDNIGAGVTTLAVGIEIAAFSGPTTSIGLRNASTTRLTAAVTVGADAAVTAGLILDITGNAGIKNEGELRLYDSGSSNYIGIRSNNARTTDLVYVLPVTDPTAGQILSASAPVAGVVTLSWAADATGGGGGAHDHTTADGSGVLTNDEHDGYLNIAAIATPSSPSAGAVRFFTRTSGNTIEVVAISATGDECIICTLINVAHTNTLALNWIQ